MEHVFVIAVGVLLLGVALELGARQWIRRRARYYVLPPGLRLRLYTDPEVFPELERVARFEVNSDGERGGKVPRPRRGLYRVRASFSTRGRRGPVPSSVGWTSPRICVASAPSAFTWATSHDQAWGRRRSI